MLVTLSTGVRIFFDVEGVGLVADGPQLRPRPTLVLVHGAEVDHSFFKPWLSPLREQAQLVYIDLIGHGRSDAGTEADWTLDGWADAIDELCDRLGIAHPVLLGSSLGGRVVMKLALRHPERPQALVLVNTVGVVRPERRIEMLRKLGGDKAAEAARRDHEQRTAQTTADYFRLCMPLMTRRPYGDDELARLRPVAPGVMARLIELGTSLGGPPAKPAHDLLSRARGDRRP